MEFDKSESNSKLDSKSDMITSKLFTSQNIIKKKFEKARMNQVDQENDTNHAMKSLTTFPHAIASALSSDSKTKEPDFPYRNHASKKFISHQRLAPKTGLMETVKKREYNINTLCKRLRLLLSPQFANSEIHMHEISTILNDLHDLEIII